MSWSLSFTVPEGPPSERAASVAAAFLPVIEQQRPFGEGAVQVLHNLAGAASAAARGLDAGRAIQVVTHGHIGPAGGEGSVELHVRLVAS